MTPKEWEELEKLMNKDIELTKNINLGKFFNFIKNECYCCSSITCSANQSPALSLPNILLEFLEIKFIEKYSQPDEYKELENIYNYLHKEYFNKLPTEIYELVINQI